MSNGRDLFAPKLGLTLPLCGLHFVFFFLAVADPRRTAAAFGFWPQQALTQPWTFLTFQFLHTGPMSLFFGAMALYILGGALEAEWGTGEFAAFWAVASLGATGAAWVLGTPLVTDPFVVPVSMLFAYAYLFPDMQFLVFFVVPVKVKWLAWFTAGMLLFDFFRAGLAGSLLPGLVRLLGAGAGFLYFWLRHQGRWKARKAVKEAVTAARVAGAQREDQHLEKRNRDLFPRVEELRAATRSGEPLPARLAPFPSELQKLVVPGVNVCKPLDFKGDRDLTCLRCDGFAECSLRYVAGQPGEIVVKERG